MTRRVKKNPDPITTFAQLAGGIASALHIKEMVKRKPARKRPVRRNPKPAHKVLGTLYVLTISRGDDVESVYLHDGKGDGFSKKFRTMASAKAFATKNKKKLMPNPANLTHAVKRNVEGFIDGAGVFHPIRGSADYDEGRVAAEAHRTVLGSRSTRMGKATRKRLTGGTPRKPAPKGTVKRSAAPAQKPAAKRSRTVSQPTLFNPKRIEAGQVLEARSAVDYDTIFRARVLDRKGSFVTVLTDLDQKPRRVKVRVYNGEEYIRPDNYSMAPIYKPKANPGRTGSGPTGRSIRKVSTKGRSRRVLKKVTARRATIRKHTKANPVQRTNARRRTFENFQGRRCEIVKPMPVSRHAGTNARMDQLGKLHEIKLLNGPVIKFNPSRHVLAAMKGRLWIVGPAKHPRDAKQNPNVLNPIGHVDHVVYETFKPHHGDPPRQRYIHKLGEEGGTLPLYCLDSDGFPVLKGGQYKIRREGIRD